MSFKDRLNFVLDRERTDGYSTKHYYKTLPYDDFLKDLKLSVLDSKTLSHCVTTQSHRSLMGNHWVMVLDCDGQKEKDMAVQDLGSRHISTYVVTSSYLKDGENSHYWVFGNIVDNFHKVMSEMKISAGVDRRYISFCDDKKVLNLRAYPKNLCLPVFPEITGYVDGNLAKWLVDFRDYWYGNDMKFIIRQLAYKWEKEAQKSSSTNTNVVLRKIGSHLSPEQYKKMQLMLFDDIEEVKPYENKNTVNCLYGLEI